MSGFAFLFPGQASQKVGMGQDFYENDTRVRELYDAAESFLKFPLKQLSFKGPLEELTKTQYTQPAIYVHSCAVDLLLKEKQLIPVAAAGHSLGEFSAYVSAGVINFKEGLKLVKLRGELMGKAGDIHPGAMTAIIGLDSELVEEACKEAGGIVIPANYNSPGQLVISGEVEAVHRAGKIAKAKGAKIVKPLTVSGAFHSPLMNYASEKLYKALDEIEFKAPKFPVYTNVTAKPAENADQAKELLKRQLLNPVRWEETIRNLLSVADSFIEAGPGNILSGLLKRIDRGAVSSPLGNFEALKSFEYNK